MGVVYAAHDPKLARTVALKIVRASRLAGRSLREAQAMARLAHPNVVAVHDVITQDDELVIVLELVATTPRRTNRRGLAAPLRHHARRSPRRIPEHARRARVTARHRPQVARCSSSCSASRTSSVRS